MVNYNSIHTLEQALLIQAKTIDPYQRDEIKMHNNELG
ncbi:hypothetical protein N748_16615 [Legionella pneumophila str. 121004]|nr:hypothetical protein N748_16615 [Legionella pneumophila str. 121004]ERH45718.1 hypothetical protein N750_06420 [Legionella pneumophila str. Leg01/53]ERH46462.1 hypothetical protein N751_07990 [Legionella pneumophila str. Leg01/11]ERI47242.1 hypothetical protein N749_15130 [Legionella pneumophila str. Leg01/20]